jgi:hypothetical protein
MVLGSSQVFAANQCGFGPAECGWGYLREASVVPEVTLVGEAVTDEAELALLDVLLDGVEELLLGDLWNLLGFVLAIDWHHRPRALRWSSEGSQRPCSEGSSARCPSCQFRTVAKKEMYNILGVERDIVERRDRDTILLDEDAVLCTHV